MLLLMTTPAEANFGSQWNPSTGPPDGVDDSPSLANNSTHAVRLGSSNQWVVAAATHGVAKLNATEMTAYLTTTDSVPDVWVLATIIDQSSGFIGGRAYCPANNSNWGSHGASLMWCRGQIVQIATNAVGSTAIANWTGCHELGHTVGLRHLSGTTCMNTSNPVADYSAHDLDHINGFY